ncbi:hypothetical protein LTS16_022740 [Friedmanniomyces endolithicus]|nr:hypothetical protein LTR57_012276 [Friedmanniomyces endolithicus]KAK1025958.1 hypothetical protein LTS16_022740 [Friedmanniomyces endolithicus]
MADTEPEKTAPQEYVHTSTDFPDGAEVEIPQGWMYRSRKLGPITFPWYASPQSQLILVAFVCFLCPGMFNALGGLGGGGQVTATVNDASNTALYSTFALVGFFAGTITNALGIRIALSFGGIGYCIYTSSYLCFDHTQNFGYSVFAGFFLGICAGVLWCAQGAIMMSYPPEHQKGRYIAVFWGIFNMGGVIGALRRHKSDLMQHPTWKSEFIGLWETLISDPWIICLWPMFFASNWFYTYQFNDVNLAQFNTRTRALNNVLYWFFQIVGAVLFSFILDFPGMRRTTRAKTTYTRAEVNKGADTPLDPSDDYVKMDWTSHGYIGPMFLFIFYGVYDAAWQTSIYWFMGATTNNSRKLANFAGFYKGIQSAGAAIIWRLDGLDAPPPYMNIFASCWALLAGGLIIAAPVLLMKIKDTVSVEEDVKFTDESVDDVVAHKIGHEAVDQEKV